MTIKAQSTAASEPRPRPLPCAEDPDLRELAALAAGCLLVSDAAMYGLIDSGPGIDRARCREILAHARRHGIEIAPQEAEAGALSLMASLGVIRP